MNIAVNPFPVVGYSSSFVQGGYTPRFKLLPFNILIFIKIVPLLCTHNKQLHLLTLEIWFLALTSAIVDYPLLLRELS